MPRKYIFIWSACQAQVIPCAMARPHIAFVVATTHCQTMRKMYPLSTNICMWEWIPGREVLCILLAPLSHRVTGDEMFNHIRHTLADVTNNNKRGRRAEKTSLSFYEKAKMKMERRRNESEWLSAEPERKKKKWSSLIQLLRRGHQHTSISPSSSASVIYTHAHGPIV